MIGNSFSALGTEFILQEVLVPFFLSKDFFFFFFFFFGAKPGAVDSQRSQSISTPLTAGHSSSFSEWRHPLSTLNWKQRRAYSRCCSPWTFVGRPWNSFVIVLSFIMTLFSEALACAGEQKLSKRATLLVSGGLLVWRKTGRMRTDPFFHCHPLNMLANMGFLLLLVSQRGSEAARKWDWKKELKGSKTCIHHNCWT